MIERDRIARIKAAHLNLLMNKPKVKKVKLMNVSINAPGFPIVKKTKSTPIIKIKRDRREYNHEYKKKRRELGLCVSCKRTAVNIQYIYEGKLILSTTSKNCPNCWESKSTKALFNLGEINLGTSNTTDISTKHETDTVANNITPHGDKSDEDNRS